MRSRILTVLALVGVALLAAPAVRGQKPTERYIPIGESPGLSHKYTYIGPIAAVDMKSRTLTYGTGEDRRSVQITERTRIWLDRSEARLTNLTGSVEDCKPGRTVEIKFEDHDTRRHAEWIKVKHDGVPAAQR